MIGPLKVKNLQIGHDLPASVKDRMISSFFKGFISQNFASVKFCENKTLTKTPYEVKSKRFKPVLNG